MPNTIYVNLIPELYKLQNENLYETDEKSRSNKIQFYTDISVDSI
jgi:hypothetical protein